MSSPVIICPDRFAQELSFRRTYDVATWRTPSHSARRHPHKQAEMCNDCLFGKHTMCRSASCSCIHRENEPFT
jgi:hypothetical protein